MIVYVMSRRSLLLYITFVNTFNSGKNTFGKDKKVIVWKVIFPYFPHFTKNFCETCTIKTW